MSLAGEHFLGKMKSGVLKRPWKSLNNNFLKINFLPLRNFFLPTPPRHPHSSYVRIFSLRQ
jgi:hypothetical protein